MSERENLKPEEKVKIAKKYLAGDDLRHDHGIHVNDKRVLRICRVRDIRSTVKYNNRGCTRQAKNPQYLAENLLDRQLSIITTPDGCSAIWAC